MGGLLPLFYLVKLERLCFGVGKGLNQLEQGEHIETDNVCVLMTHKFRPYRMSLNVNVTHTQLD